MPQIVAWECPRTGKLFKEKDQYQKYIRALARQERARKAEEQRKANKAEFFKNMRLTCRTAGDVEEFIKANWIHFVNHAMDVDHAHFLTRRKQKQVNVLDVKLTLGKYGKCSCSHSAPIGKPTNFMSKPNIPTHYWGYKGRLEFKYDAELSFFPSHMFEGTGINCGSGSGGGRSYSCEVTLFGDDWPTMSADDELSAILTPLIAHDCKASDYF